VAAIDPAARRAARFDRVIEVPPPGELARQRILATYLAPLERTDLDLAVVARAATEATGADLRELVRHAVLRHGGSFSTSDLLALVRDGRGNEGGGQYL
jgi:SpoVK/Ycf46/Vps4 family AAA+-type ATPase